MKLPTQEDLQKVMEKYQDKENSVENIESMLKDMFKDTLQTMLEAEMENHLWYEKHSNNWDKSWNSRNWYNKKKVISNSWNMELSVPRDRNWVPQAYTSLNLNP